MGTDVVLEVDGLTKRYGECVAVRGLSFRVHRGEILGFLGPNGAGKTTSLKMMCGLLKPDHGKIEILGKPLVPGRSRGLREVGVAPQNLVIWEMLTCLEQLELVARLYDRPRSEAKQRAEHLLRVFGLQDKARRLGRTLSGGMQRRLNIALGLAHEPELLFLDEPQAGLDPQSRVMVRDYIQSLRGTMTVVITTHDMEEAEKLADRVCVIDHGEVLALDTVAGIKNQLGAGTVFEVCVDQDVREALLPAVAPLASPETFVAEAERLLVPATGSAELLTQVLGAAGRLGLRITAIRTREATLEDVFIRLTGRRLRE